MSATHESATQESATQEKDTPAAIEVRDLVKRYPKGASNAVDGLSFSVAPGEIFGLLGPNGAGKTTTVGILTTLILSTGGVAKLHGVDVGKDPVGARRLLAMVPQRNNLDRSLSAKQNLTYHAAYHGASKRERERQADDLLDQFGLAGRGDDRVDRYSGGQVQRLMIARALMHRPAVLFLDEPATGLDPQARLFVWDRIRELRESGITILLTTHDMDEAAELSDRVGIMDHGKLLALDTPGALTRAVAGESTLELLVSAAEDATVDDLVAALCEVQGVEQVERVGAKRPSTAAGGVDQRLRLYLTAEAPDMVGPANAVVVKHGASVADFTMGRPSLEDVFIGMTGRGLR